MNMHSQGPVLLGPFLVNEPHFLHSILGIPSSTSTQVLSQPRDFLSDMDAIMIGAR